MSLLAPYILFPAAGGGGSAPNYQGITAFASGADAVDIAWPTHATDDVGIVIMEQRDADPAEAAPTDWNLLTPQHASSNCQMIVYWSRATGSSMANFAVGDPGQHWGGGMLLFRGCSTSSTPIIDLNDDTDVGDTAIDIPAGTTSGTNRLVMPICVISGAIAKTVGLTNTTLDNFTERVNFTHATGNDGGIFVGTGELASAGSTGTTTGTLASSIDQVRAVFELIP